MLGRGLLTTPPRPTEGLLFKPAATSGNVRPTPRPTEGLLFDPAFTGADYSPFTLICRGLAASAFGRWTVSTPFLHSALMRLASIDSWMLKAR